MPPFKLDERLQGDCHRLVETEQRSLLLNKNAEVAWFILVPHVQQTEFYLLGPTVQQQLCDEINRISTFIHAHFPVDKINIATIGNVVSQMHIHVIGRRKDDAYWPDVVWGNAPGKTYQPKQVDSIRKNIREFLPPV